MSDLLQGVRMVAIVLLQREREREGGREGGRGREREREINKYIHVHAINIVKVNN